METFLIKADAGMLHTHILIVSLYLLQLLVKVAFLSAGKHDRLDKFSSKTKIPHIILAVLMVATGIYLMVRRPTGMEPYVWVKLVFVLSAIPLGIVGMKKKKTALGILALLSMSLGMAIAFVKPAFLTSSGKTEIVVDQGDTGGADAAAYAAKLEAGQEVYTLHCRRCHGADGNSGFMGAKALGLSKMADADIANIIRNGKGSMKPNTELTDGEVEKVIAYVKYLRK